MHHDTALLDEAARVAAVHRTGTLDTPPDTETDRLAALVGTVFRAPIVLISLIDEKRQWIKSRIGLELDEIPREQTFCQYTIQQPGVLAIEDTHRDPRFCDHPFATGPDGIRSYLGAPLTTADGYNVGTICISDFKPRRFEPHEIDMLRQFAGVAMANFELRQIAGRDFLTGTWSRRAFIEIARKEISRFHRHRQPVSVALLDLDRFKSINDTLGHPAGDAVLKAAAQTLQDAMRQEETIGRLGGEEFAVLMANTGTEGARMAAERMRRAIEASRAPAFPELRYTASFGVAMLTPDDGDVDAWLARADRALYRAKELGRNRVEVA